MGLLELQRRAKSLLNSASFTDHSDVGLAQCQQKIAELFANQLILNILHNGNPLHVSTLVRFASNSVFYKNENEMNRESKKMISLAKLVSLSNLLNINSLNLLRNSIISIIIAP